jgi:hypothetical protein
MFGEYNPTQFPYDTTVFRRALDDARQAEARAAETLRFGQYDTEPACLVEQNQAADKLLAREVGSTAMGGSAYVEDDALATYSL